MDMRQRGRGGLPRDLASELEAATARFDALVEQSISGIYVIQDERFVYVNPRMAHIFGYGAPAEVVGLKVDDVVAPEDRATVTANIASRLEGRVKSIAYTFQGLRKDGRTFDVGVHGTIASYEGRPAIIGALQDISERLRAEQAIKGYVAKLEHAMHGTLEVVSKMVELRDPYTRGHERRVGEICAAIGAELGLAAERIEGLRVAGGVHDVGKIAAPAEILSKPSRLTPAEYELVKQHSQLGFEILKEVEFPWPVAEVTWQHHERMDGSGYPRGLKGDEILLEARILAVADTVEAMSSHRPYRAGLGLDKALAEIERGRDTQYCVLAVDACLRLFREKGYTLPA
jgi:PAS domain S-box-containing protein